MNVIQQIITNKAIVAPAFGWFTAQIIKVILVIINDKKVNFERFVGTGGMPSAHATFIVALATIVGRFKGWDSIEFGIAVAISIIVMFDAASIRRAAGLQAKMLNRLIYENKLPVEKELKELLGHTPVEVAAGALLGIVIGVLA